MRSLDYVILLILAAFFVWLLVLTTRATDVTNVGITPLSPTPTTQEEDFAPDDTRSTIPSSSPATLVVPSPSVLPSPSAVLRSPSASPSAL